MRCKQETQVLLFRRTHTHNGEALLVLSEEDVATCGCLRKDPDDKGEHCTKTGGQFLEDALVPGRANGPSICATHLRSAICKVLVKGLCLSRYKPIASLNVHLH